MRSDVIGSILGAMAMIGANVGVADTIQWASTVEGFSSEYSGGWDAIYALGAPDAAMYGDYPGCAWAPWGNGQQPEFLELGYSTPVYATGVGIVECYHNGFVYQVDLLDTNDVWHTAVWMGPDPTPEGSVQEFDVAFPQTAYAVLGVRVNTQIAGWEEIDAVKLTGVAVPEPATLALLAILAVLLAVNRWRTPAC
jgi:hypothetical protein